MRVAFLVDLMPGHVPAGPTTLAPPSKLSRRTAKQRVVFLADLATVELQDGNLHT
jgi:hypothetical protein